MVFIIVSLLALITKYFSSEHINKDRTCGACSTHRDIRNRSLFLVVMFEGNSFLEDMAVGEGIILN
jgi:hypothetical protein